MDTILNQYFPEYYLFSGTGESISTNATLRHITSDSCEIVNMGVYGLPEIKDVIFNDPATIVMWEDGTKTVVKCQKQNGDTYSKETGLAMAIVKKVYGNKGNYNNILSKWMHD